MKTVLVTTTINVPHVLKLYRAIGPEVPFIVIADEKTPQEAYEFCAGIPDCEIYSPMRQKELGYECSAVIGWNSIQRRNIGFLEALKAGADIIVSVDDDNIPFSRDDYFQQSKFGLHPFSGLKACSPSGWFDVGALLRPQASHRGFPHGRGHDVFFESVVDARVGVSAGICLGDPDIHAALRITSPVEVHNVSEILKAGVIVESGTFAVFNSQNTAFLRELAPAMMMWPGVGRYDDIFASLICQRVMQSRNLHVHFGQPFVWQQRNKHDLIKDLKAEIYGMETVERLAVALDSTLLTPGTTLVGDLVGLYLAMYEMQLVSEQTYRCAMAYLADCEKVL